MNELELFFADAVDDTEEVPYVVSSRFHDKKGKPLEWKLKAVSSEVSAEIKKECTKRVAIVGRKGQFTNEFDSVKFMGLLCSHTVVYPDLNSAALQDSWSKKTGKEILNSTQLLNAMLLAGEMDMLSAKVNQVNGYSNDVNDQAEDAKNS